MKTLSIKLSDEIFDEFEKIYSENEEKLRTKSLFLEELLNRFYEPVKNNKKTVEELESTKEKLQEAESKLKEYEGKLQKVESNLQTESEKIKSLNVVNVELEKSLLTISELENRLKNSIELDDFTLAVLNFIADRETKKYKREIKSEHVVKFFVENRFVKGSLNGGLNSISDSEVAKIKKACIESREISKTPKTE